MIPQVYITFTPPLDSLIAQIRGAIRGSIKYAMVSTVETGEKILREEEPIKTSNMVNSTESHVIGDVDGVIKVTAPYSIYVNDGTGIFHTPDPRQPYVIKASNMKALCWPGAKHPVKLVHRQGNKPNPFVDRMLARWQPQTIFEQKISEYLRSKGD